MELSYGDRQIELSIPEANLAGHVKPKHLHCLTDVATRLEQAMAEASPTLYDCAVDSRVVVLIADHTRSQPHLEMAKVTLRELKDAEWVTIVIATGDHNPNSKNDRLLDELKAEAERLELPDVRYEIHNCRTSRMVDLGKTHGGTPVRFNAAVRHADLFVVNSDMTPHYFAGYYSGLKYFMPGISAFESIEANHSLALKPTSTFGLHPLHPDMTRRHNAIAQDMVDYFRIIVDTRPVFGLTMIGSETEVCWAQAGFMLDGIADGIGAVDEMMITSVPHCEHVVVSCGGYPGDESLYSAQGALELTCHAYQPGGEVLLLAECRNGICPTDETKKNFYEPLCRPLPDVKKLIEDDYVLYTHKAYKFAVLLDRLKALYLHSELKPADVEQIHMTPATDPQKIVDQWLAEQPDCRILVFDEANKLAVL